MASGLLDKANIILTPTGYKAGTMYNVAPIEQPYEDFVFSRASVASRVNSSGLVEMVGRTLGSELVQNGDFSEIGPDLVQNGTFDLGSELVQNGDFSELGSELITNGDFATDSDWTPTNGATITGGALNIDYNLGNGSTTQSNVFTIGKTYKIQLNVDDSSTGTARIHGGVPATILSNGLNTFYLTATGTTLEIRNHVNFVGSIDNVSVKEVDPNDYWTLGGGATIGNNKANINGDGSSFVYINQSNNPTKTNEIHNQIYPQ